MSIIYKASGKAGEYAPLAVNLYKGCTHGCTYCYGPAATRKKREKFHGSTSIKKDGLILLSQEAEKLKIAGDDREILMSFVTDPYQTIESEANLTQEAIKIFKQNNLRFSILTKGGLRAVRDFDLLVGYNKSSFGSTIIFNKQADADKWEPNAADIDIRIEAIKEAHGRGIRTWVSLEPVICPDQALELIEKLHPIVDYWKVGKLNYMRLDVDWLKFRNDATSLFDSLGAHYYLKKSLRDIDQPREKQKRKIVATAQPARKITSSREASLKPWIEGDIPVRQGKRNILVIAPHGHSIDDAGTYELGRLIADQLDCYAVVNNRYRKPKNVKKGEDYPADYQVDLNLWDDLNNSPNAKTDFLGPIDKFKKEILENHKSLLVLHIHGIGNKNLKKVAELLPEYKGRTGDINFLIGYGQRKNDDTRLTANFEKVIRPLLSQKRGLRATEAPVDPIIDEDGQQRWYCGNDLNRLNQALCNPKAKIKSLQLEFRESGLRDSAEGMADASKNISEALIAIWGVVTSELEAEDLKTVYAELMSIWSKKSESTMFKAGWLLFETFYNASIEAAKADKKKARLESLYQYIQSLHAKDPFAPKKSWIYNSVKLATEYKELKSYLKKDFHLYGKDLSLSQKVLLFPIDDLEMKVRLIRESSGKDMTVAQFKEKVAALDVVRKKKSTQAPQLLRCIGKPEMVFSDEMSKFLEPAALRNMPPQIKERLQAGATEGISRLQKNIERETGYVKRYQQLIKMLHGMSGVYTTQSKERKSDPPNKVTKQAPGGEKDSKQNESKGSGSPQNKARKFSGWDKIEIEKQDGTKAEAIAPVIISASRRTDIPAFHSEWFMNRLRKGYLINSWSGKIITSFAKARLIVFWTKNPEPLIKHLAEIDKMGIGYYFQYTLNDYEAERYEPNIPPLKNRIEMFKTLSGLIGPKKVIWRFDPLILSDVISIERLVEKVYGVMSQIVGHTEKLVFSFLKADKQVRVAQNLTQKGIKYRAFAPEEIGFIVDHLDQMSKEFKIEVSSCAEELEQSPCKINQNKCIDDGLMKRLFSDKEPLIKFIDEYKNLKDPGQRKLCKCVRSVDIGKKNTCRHFCPYCYANTSEKAVMNNFKRINPTAEMLLPPKANILTGGEKNPNKDLPN